MAKKKTPLLKTTIPFGGYDYLEVSTGDKKYLRSLVEGTILHNNIYATTMVAVLIKGALPFNLNRYKWYRIIKSQASEVILKRCKVLEELCIVEQKRRTFGNKPYPKMHDGFLIPQFDSVLFIGTVFLFSPCKNT